MILARVIDALPINHDHIKKGAYRSISYALYEKSGKRYLELSQKSKMRFRALGADMSSLRNIGDLSPEEAIDVVFASVSE